MEERRQVIRSRSLKGGKIVFNNRHSIMDCTVRNMSATGAKLLLGETVGIPDSFELVSQPGGEARQCRVIWRHAKEIGVSFG